MTQSLYRAALASLFAAAALSACSSNSNPSSSCTTTADCASGDTCTAGQCLAPGQCASGILSCSDSTSCGSGNVCTNGCCAPVEGCAASSDCTTPTRPYCNTTTHACVACANSTECATGKICIASGACEASCTSDTNCAAPTPYCVTSGGYCAQCTESSQCPASTPICSDNTCTGCTSNANCAAPTPVCNTSTKGCVTCIDSQNGANGKNSACPAATPACESGACVACNPASNTDAGTNGACSGTTPSCGSGSTCVACSLSSECPSGSVCNSSNTCEALALVSFTSSASTLVINGTATLTATLNGAVTSPVTIDVAISADGGSVGTLSAATIVISSGSSGTVTYTAPSSDGTAIVDATLGSTTLSATINVSSAALDLASIDLASSTAAQPGSAVQATVSLTAAPAADTVVAVSVNNGATINGSASASITVPAGSATSAPFTIQLACNSAATTATATLGSTVKTVAIPLDTSAPAVASIAASPASIGMGQAVSLTVTLTQAAGCGGARVSLASAIAYPSTSKYNGYVPSSITVPAGQTSASIAAVPECYNGSSDLVTVVASTAAATTSTTPIVASTTIQVTPSSGLASGAVVLCPIMPVSADRPTTYLLADGGTAPLPVLLSVGFADYKPPLGAYSISLAASGVDGGSCGTFTQDGGPISGLSMATPTKVDISFVPSGSAGACNLYAQGTLIPSDGGTSVTYDAGIVSTFNLIDYDWTQQQTPTDLTLTKAEIDEDTNVVGTTNGLSDGGPRYGDATEYVEIYNPTANSIDLSAYALVFVGSPFDSNNGTATAKSEYWSYPLSGTLQPGHYAIAQDANTFATAPTANTDQLLTWPDAGYAASVAAGLDGGSSGALRVGNLWNTPGGIFLVKNPGVAGSATIVDGLTYGAPMQQATSLSVTGADGGVFSWPPAPLAPLDNWIVDSSFVKGSLVRIGWTGSPALDWADSTTVTPGTANTTITGP